MAKLKKPKKKIKDEEIVCLTCIRGNRKVNIEDGICLTCKRMNRKQEVIKV